MSPAQAWGRGLVWPPAPLNTVGMGSGTPWCHGNTRGLRQQLQEERQISSSCEYKGIGLHPHPHVCWVRDGMLGVTPARWPEPPLGAPGAAWGWPRKQRGTACILRGLISSSKAATATRSEGGQLHGAAHLGWLEQPQAQPARPGDGSHPNAGAERAQGAIIKHRGAAPPRTQQLRAPPRAGRRCRG